MNMSTKIKAASIAGVGVAAVGAVHATSLLNSDSFDFLPSLGENLGSFLTSLFNALLPIAVVLLILGAIVAILIAVAHWMGKGFGSMASFRRR
jgi:hypothetical protein